VKALLDIDGTDESLDLFVSFKSCVYFVLQRKHEETSIVTVPYSWLSMWCWSNR